MEEKARNVFVVLSAAIPTIDKMNTLATKVTAACLRSSRAEAIAQMVKENQGEEIVYGLQCKIYTSVVETQLTGELKDGEQEVYVLVSAAIPLKKGMHPVKSNVHSVCTDQQTAEELFKKKKVETLHVRGVKCETHVSIIPIRLDKS